MKSCGYLVMAKLVAKCKGFTEELEMVCWLMLLKELCWKNVCKADHSAEHILTNFMTGPLEVTKTRGKIKNAR